MAIRTGHPAGEVLTNVTLYDPRERTGSWKAVSAIHSGGIKEALEAHRHGEKEDAHARMDSLSCMNYLKGVIA